MGGGSWTSSAFTTYSTSVGRGVSSSGVVDCVLRSDGTKSSSFSNQDMYLSKRLDEKLNPYKVLRECVDSEEHPNTVPVILALDVTGSMGESAVEVSKYLNKIMTSLYDKVKDVEFMIMGIGDVECDRSPLQVSQFESDIRIAEQLDKLYFEFGGGGNYYESYSLAWYFGLNHTKLDCWNRGRKGIIITIGDERLNPMIERKGLVACTGDSCQSNVETSDLYKAASEKFNIYHIDVDHRTRWDDGVDKSWEMLGDNYRKSNMNNLSDVIVDIISNDPETSTSPFGVSVGTDGISW